MRRWLPGRVLDAVSLHVSGIRRKVRESLLLKAVAHHTDQRWVLHVRRAVASGPAGAAGRNADGTGLWNTRKAQISPLLANVYLHYAFDAWMRRVFPSVPFERYADDAIVALQQPGAGRAGARRDPRPAGRSRRPGAPGQSVPGRTVVRPGPTRPDRAFRIRAWMTSPVSAPVASSGCGRAPSCSRRAALLGVAWTSQIVEPTSRTSARPSFPRPPPPRVSASSEMRSSRRTCPKAN